MSIREPSPDCFWEIHFDSKENNFTYTSMFGKKTIVYYQDVTKARRYKDGVFFMVGKKYIISTLTQQILMSL